MNVQSVGRRVSAVSSREVDQLANVIAGSFNIHVIFVNVLFDSDATCSFLARSGMEGLKDV